MAKPPDRGTYISTVFDHTDAEALAYGVYTELEWDPHGKTEGHVYVETAVNFVVINSRLPRRPQSSDIDRIDWVIVSQLRSYADTYSLRKPPHFEDRLDVLCNLMSGE